MKKPTKCSKCGSKNIAIKYCEGVKSKRDSLLTWVPGGGGFVCKEIGEHFHYHCKECGYSEYKAA